MNFKIDQRLVTFIRKNKEKLYLVAEERINYEIQKIVNGTNAIDSLILIKKYNIFGHDNFSDDSFFLNLKKINYSELNKLEKEKFYLFFISKF